MNNIEKVIVSSLSFSKNTQLRNELKTQYTNVSFNDTGRLLEENELIRLFEGATMAIVGTEKISDKVLDYAPKLKCISKYGVGLDNLDTESLKKRGIRLGWSGGVNKRSVSEMTLSFMIALIRNLYPSSIQLKNGEWNKQGGRQLSSKTIGIIGVGEIGKDVIELLTPFNCQILVNDVIDQETYYQEHGLESVSKDQLFQNADIISLHTPLTKETYHLINRDSLSMMKETAFIINTARGGVVDQEALKLALDQEIIAGAALDVFETEPETDRALLGNPKVFSTPHIGGNAEEAILAMGQSAISNLTG